ncbi:MAG TPA: hypothetical protein VNZ46_24715, partial [Pedobacter sp.]|nr:hypothetical protein [Pedobacter sp.]
MKRLSYILFPILLLTGSFWSCKKALEQPPLGSLSETIIANKNGVNGLLVGAYAGLYGMQGGDQGFGGTDAWQAAPSNWVFGAIAGGDASKGSDGSDQPAIDPIANFYSDGTNAFYNGK